MAIDGFYDHQTKRDMLGVSLDLVDVARELVRRNPELSLDTACRVVAAASLSLDIASTETAMDNVADAIDEWRKKVT